VNRTGSGSCSEVGFGTSGVEPSGCVTRVLQIQYYLIRDKWLQS
jgi:hypothetical protein